MGFSYHPPARTKCEVCEEIANKHELPLISTADGRASSADNFSFHNWYNFVLGYTPKFPDYIIKKRKIPKTGIIADPFMGSGTTNLCAKAHGIKSMGIDANDFFEFAARTKLNWQVDIKIARKIAKKMLNKALKEYGQFSWPADAGQNQLPLLGRGTKDHKKYAVKHRPAELPERYISDAPLTKLLILKDIISKYNYPNEKICNLFALAFTAITVPASNVYYGPGFGVRKPRDDADIYGLFKKKINRMINDLDDVNKKAVAAPTKTYLGDARSMSAHFGKSKIDLMITSPPYPGDHEYTKHSKLELIFMDFATDLKDFRVIKKRMLRGSTTNIYKEDV